MRYRPRKTRYVEAIQYTGDNEDQIIRWSCREAEQHEGRMRVRTQVGWVPLQVGDFLVRYEPHTLTVTPKEEFLEDWEPDVTRPSEYDQVLRIAYEARDLRRQGYDGPFMGEDVSPLFRAIREWETG